jgi:hypothetical protein
VHFRCIWPQTRFGAARLWSGRARILKSRIERLFDVFRARVSTA